jgi:hypothetical protein
MKRREFLVGLLVTATTASAQAQQKGKVYRLAVVDPMTLRRSEISRNLGTPRRSRSPSSVKWPTKVSAYLDAASTAVSKTAMPADRLRGDFGKEQIRNAETLSRCTP